MLSDKGFFRDKAAAPTADVVPDLYIDACVSDRPPSLVHPLRSPPLSLERRENAECVHGDSGDEQRTEM